MGKLHRSAALPFAAVLLLSLLPPRPAQADPGINYCVKPPFITSGIKPNLLLMIDNSSSMYDLVYADEGKVTGGTMTRQPNYCYDATYMAQVCTNDSTQSCTAATAATKCGAGNACIANGYAGYFDQSKYYDYDFTNKYFSPIATFPASSVCDYFIAGTLCVKIDASVSPNKVSRFSANGNYLNWLTASKLDVEKQIITGGKYVQKVCKDATAKVCTSDSDCAAGTSCGTVNGLQAESRGCVGQGFIKDALASDFVNYNAGSTDPNTKLGITFSVRGPLDSANASAPSRGGQTFIEVYRGVYNDKACQAAIEIWGDGSANQSSVRTAVENCLNYNASGTNYCSGNPTLSCTTDPDCVFPGTAAIAGKCSNNATLSCSADTDCGTSTTAGTCSNIAGQSCTSSSTCVKTWWGECSNQSKACNSASDCTIAGSKGSCSNQSKQCSTAGDCTIAEVLGTCSNSNTACRASSDCTIAAVQGRCSQNSAITCSVNADCGYTVTAGSGRCSGKHGNSYDPCTTDADCGTKYGTCSNPYPTSTLNGTCTNPAPAAAKNGSCNGYTPVSTGSCNGVVPDNTGTCSGWGSSTGTCNGVTTVQNRCNNPAPVAGTTRDYSPCVNPNQSPATKTKIAYSHTIQTCWSYWKNGSFSNGDSQRLTGECDSVYAAWGVCSGDNTRTCSVTTDCSASGLGSCVHGPTAIRPGNPAYVCSQEYMGQFCRWPDPNATGSCTWNITNADATFASFCNSTQPATVIDPTDSAATTSNHETVPAILSGVGVEAQLGMPIGTLPVKVALDAPPSGLVQEFGNDIRIGAMSFNQFGSYSEASSTSGATIITPNVCSNDPSRLCTQNADCGSGSCRAAASGENLDGGKIIYPIGLGYCSAATSTTCTPETGCSGNDVCYGNLCMTPSTTACTTDHNCGSASPVCVSKGVGSHTTAGTLIKSLDDIRANAWTPLAEAFYDVIGYFAQIAAGSDAGKSRTDLRLNSINTASADFSSSAVAPLDFNESLNPSQYRCQQNYSLLITDGSSAADQSSSVNSLASMYAGQAGLTAGTCPNYLGSKNLPILTWLARNRNIGTLALSGTPSTAAPVNPRDSITSYVVLNGGATGQSGDCDSFTLLNNAATKGGTSLKMADNPQALRSALRSVFQDVAAKAASGTAASILSNSEGSGANILQAVFYPKKVFENQTYATWIGEMQNLWYYVDPMIKRSTIREDTTYTTGDTHTLDLALDKVVTLKFNSTDNTTYAYFSSDANGDGVVEPSSTDSDPRDFDDVKSIWRAGRSLFLRNIGSSPRRIYTTTDGSSMIPFSLAKASELAPYLNATSSDAASPDYANNVISYVLGNDHPELGYRKRTVTYKGVSGVWRLGDIISSTPRIQSSVTLNQYGQPSPFGYSDASYNSFAGSNEYKRRGMVYVGANDGMLHAFKLGVLDVVGSGTVKGHLRGSATDGSDLGQERWAYIPKQALPYLKYYTDSYYDHIYSIDGTSQLVDASIGDYAGGCNRDNYDSCLKYSSVVDSGNNLDTSRNTWRTVLVGGMGLGGASSKSCAAGSNCVQTPLTDPVATGNGLGYSSYFALDVTDPENPSLLWEFSDPTLGYATTGPAIVRVGDPLKNGRWFAVFGSGPTGGIDTQNHQFMGRSDQNLKFFAVDLRTGASTPIPMTTAIANAFAGSMVAGAIDADRWNPATAGNYQDDAIYVGYTQKTEAGSWTGGGVLRIVTNENADPSRWTVSTVVSNTGPVTSSISRLQDRKNKHVWLYFGTGRYFYKVANLVDDNDTPRSIFGIKDPCYNTDSNPGNLLDKSCTATVDALGSGITNQTTDNPADLKTAADIGAGGWKIDLDQKTAGFGAERVVADAVALTNGTVFLTSFAPTTDACGFGGNSYLWALDYQSGGRPPDAALKGKALIQLSTGEFKELDLTDAFGAGASKAFRRTSSADPMTGKSSKDGFTMFSNSGNKPVKRILHIQER